MGVAGDDFIELRAGEIAGADLAVGELPDRLEAVVGAVLDDAAGYWIRSGLVMKLN